MFETNVFSALVLAQGFIKKMVTKKSGKIVFTSSMGGFISFPYATAYCASKKPTKRSKRYARSWRNYA